MLPIVFVHNLCTLFSILTFPFFSRRGIEVKESLFLIYVTKINEVDYQLSIINYNNSLSLCRKLSLSKKKVAQTAPTFNSFSYLCPKKPFFITY